jgi:hypothetical protein
MTTLNTVFVEIDGGARAVIVNAWIVAGDNMMGASHGEFRVPKPDWSRVLPGYRVEETIDGRYVAFRERA